MSFATGLVSRVRSKQTGDEDFQASMTTSETASSAAQPPPPPPPAPQPQPGCYALSDEEYARWKRAWSACQSSPASAAVLGGLSERLRNWRDPLSGQTLLHELAARGADQQVITDAIRLGCEAQMANARGRSVWELAQKKSNSSVRTKGSRGQRSSSSGDAELPALGFREPGWPRRSNRARAPDVSQETSAPFLGNAMTPVRKSASASPPSPPGTPPAISPAAAPSRTRRKGVCLGPAETARMPKAKMNLEFDIGAEEDLGVEALSAAVVQTYGGSARVQIDEVCDKAPTGEDRRRQQTVKCRVMFDSTEEARGWQECSAVSRVVQDCVAQNMSLGADAVELDAPAVMDEVDAITLQLDSDSSSILCGACLLYDSDGVCEKVVHYSDQVYKNQAQADSCTGGVVLHSGDTKVDGKSVHTIRVVQSKVPANISQMYFTLCSCGPANLSGFENPSISLYDQAEPDANLLEYTIDQAGESCSCVMARLVRRPEWRKEKAVRVAWMLRQKGMPFLCIDICLAMAADQVWSVQALGTQEWHLTTKICGNYGPAQQLIEEMLCK